MSKDQSDDPSTLTEVIVSAGDAPDDASGRKLLPDSQVGDDAAVTKTYQT
jgi:hypothetical protein